MFFFLSKFLPIFVYPLGLVCLLLIAALVLLWRRPRWAAGCLAIALGVILLGGNSYTAGAMMRSLEWQHLPVAELPNAEAIVVLGGSVRAQTDPRPWIDVMEEGDRPIHGARLFLEGKAPLLIMSGGRISWFGNQRPEADDMADLAAAFGVPTDAILREGTSLNTYENAVNVQQILQERQINRILLVTSALHMPRSLRIFQKLGIDAIPAPTDFIAENPEAVGDQSAQAVILQLLPDAQNLQQVTRVLKEYIGIVIYWLKGWL